MAEFQEAFAKLLSISSAEEIRDSVGSSKLEAEDQSFYEEIEAPKFVDFTSPHHHCPDDRYWFCLRVGCDQKHEEEMDSETIYKKFVLRVMAARSPNIGLRKALDRHASRSPAKCPKSAPPKPSKPRLSNMAIISSIFKNGQGKKGVVRSLLKPKSSTPVLKTKPVAAKYLTTPRNRVCRPNECLFRSIQNSKSTKSEVPKTTVVAKTLVFRSPRKTIKVKTSVELRTPISKLCEGMSKLEISSQMKRTLGYLSKSSKKVSDTPSGRQLSNGKMKGRLQGSSLSSQTCTKQVGKSGRSIRSKVKEKLEQQHVPPKKLLGNHHMNSSKKNELHGDKTELSEKIVDANKIKGAIDENPCISSEEATSEMDSNFLLLSGASKGNGNCEDLEGNEKSRPEDTDTQATNNNDGTGQDCSDSGGEFMNNLDTSRSSEEQKHKSEFMDGNNKEKSVASDDKESNSFEEQNHKHEYTDSDEKENAEASDENRMHNKPMKPNGRKIFGLREKYSQAESKSFKEGSISSAPATKLKKPKPTNPKPFRLRTDERRVLKEANLERKTDPPTTQSENANLSTPTGKLQRKQGSGIHKSDVVVNQKVQVPKGGLQRSKPKPAAAAASPTPGSKKHQDLKPMSSPLERLEKFRKMNSPMPMKSPIHKPKVNPQGSSPVKTEPTSFLIPGQKLDVIHEVSPEVWKSGKPSGNTPSQNDDSSYRATSHSLSSCGKRPITIAREPNFHSTHVPKSCTKNLSR